ncbi:MAG: hypothetical protein GWO87_02545 [Xanthomonadaceae bacterium]|nr:hypothetical protein [Rhodospirillaceae bacterium]NIA18044.1 hypothetical protein [Xanthomonadaceae bacterium]
MGKNYEKIDLGEDTEEQESGKNEEKKKDEKLENELKKIKKENEGIRNTAFSVLAVCSTIIAGTVVETVIFL